VPRIVGLEAPDDDAIAGGSADVRLCLAAFLDAAPRDTGP